MDGENALSRVKECGTQIRVPGPRCRCGSIPTSVCDSASSIENGVNIMFIHTIICDLQDMAFFDKETKTGEVIGRMSGDTILIQDAMGEKVGKFIQLVSTFFGGFGVAFIKGWRLALVMLSCIPPMVLAGAVMSIFISRSTIRGQRAYAEAGNIVDQTVGSIRTVMSFTGEKKAIEEYNKSLKAAYKCAAQQGLIGGIGLGTVVLVMFSSYALAVWYGSRMIIQEGYTGGEVVNVMMAVMTGGMALGQVSPSLNAFAMGSAAAYKMFEVIKQKPLIDAYDVKGAVLEDIKGDIELRNIHFRYPARPDVQIFSGFSLHIPRGTTVALVGESGSGKSTVISLVERFYDPQAGEVLIDGINLKDLRLSWMREKIGLVSQEPILFMTSIKENIAYGKPGATDEAIKKAIKLANAAKFIDKLPKGMDTMVGEHGTQLSGGQKQRIAIARAILKNPKILLLDEATSALDAESERIVQEALTRIMVDRTTVVVAHRLTTVRNADSIAVVQRGKIVEQGSHLELIMNPDGAYSQLVRLQVDSQNEERPAMDPDEINSSIEISKAPSRSASRNASLIRSISRASSSGLSIALSLVRAISTREDGSVGLGGGKDDDDDSGEAKHKAPTVRLASLNRPELPALFFGMIAAAIHGVTFPLFGLLLSSAIKIFFEPHLELRKDCKFWSLMFVSLGVIIQFVVPIQLYLFGIAGGKLIQRIRSLTFAKVVHQEISWFDDPDNSSGAVSARLSMDASSVRSLVGDTLALVVQNVATIIAALVLAMLANWQLALIILVLLPLVGLQGYAQMKFIQGFSADAKVMYEEASQVASDGVRGIRTIASFCAEQKVMGLYEQKCEVPKKHGVRQGLVSGVGFGFSFLVVFCTNALIFYAGARLVKDGKTTFSQVFKVFFSLVMAAFGISQSSAMAPNTTKAKDAAASIFAILDRKSKIDSSSDEGATLPSINGDIDFKSVSFKYPTRPDVRIFRDLCLRIRSGKTVALVGESGSGKSTVIALLERFYDPDSGKILLDGMEIQRFNLRWLRQQMGLVSQEPVLFNDTIRANITYGTEGDISEEEIIAVAKAANVHHLISGLPQGYDTCVGERGTQLSGGQKQRIAIARAILKNPKILLLDEATSALDVESEHIVQEALDKVMVNRTTIVVAHRLSTIKGADVIAVVKNGVIAEQGSHDTLVKIKDGAYASLEGGKELVSQFLWISQSWAVDQAQFANLAAGVVLLKWILGKSLEGLFT
ncbi:ATP-binding cassette sub- B member 9 [Asimina triloba]